jgi:hypothetical protein
MKFLPALIAFCFLAACSARTSDEEQVRELVASAEAAAEARDASDVLALVDDEYADTSGFDKTQLQSFLRGYFLAHPKLEIVVNISQLEFPADGLAQAELSVTSLALNDPDHVRLKVEFRRKDGAWRVFRADRLRP